MPQNVHFMCILILNLKCNFLENKFLYIFKLLFCHFYLFFHFLGSNKTKQWFCAKYSNRLAICVLNLFNHIKYYWNLLAEQSYKYWTADTGDNNLIKDH